jgi:hypothetical protein
MSESSASHGLVPSALADIQALCERSPAWSACGCSAHGRKARTVSARMLTLRWMPQLVGWPGVGVH